MRYIITLITLFLFVTIHGQQAYLVKDINTGSPASADVDHLVEFKGRIYFKADDNEHGTELWVSDGTPEGTQLFVDIQSGMFSSNPRFLTVLGDKLYFRADDQVHGQELWATDGTAEGTQRITDINSGNSDSRVEDITVFNGKLYFKANDGVHANELWVSDGTALGTHMVKDINVGGGSSSPQNFTVFDNKLYFSASDGSQDRTELWVSDGTEAGTVMLKNINPSMYGSSYPQYFTVFNNKLYFSANDGVHGIELWESDGTEAGTQMVKDILIGNAYNGSNPQGLTVYNNKIYFTADNGTNGRELFESDGTEIGTKLAVDIDTETTNGSFPRGYTVFQNKLFFGASNLSTGLEFWVSDGTAVGTQLVKDIYTGNQGSNLRTENAIVFNNKLFFTATSLEGRDQLWVSDGTELGTTLFKKIGKGSSASNARYFIDYNNEVYFQARDAIHGSELWKSDGTEAGTYMVKDNNPGSRGGIGRLFAVMNGKLYYEGDDGVHGRELWETDGTAVGTKLVKDINPGSGTSSLRYGVVFNNKLYFSAYNTTYGTELWESDGTEIGTKLVKDINPGTNGSYITELVVFNNKLYFGASGGTHGTELWESDGTEAGTQLVTDMVAGNDSSFPRYFKVYNNKLYFNAWNPTHGNELWVTDGTAVGTKLVKDIYVASSGSNPRWLAVYQGKLYFRANDGTHGEELWESDGTEAGTKLAVDINKTGNARVSEIVPFNNRLYFRADDGVFGTELWESNGTPEGTRLVADMRPGTNGSSLDDMVISNGKLFFNADDGIYQEEIWAFEPFDCTTVSSTIIYVSPTGTDTNNGYSWSEATSMQHALKLAQECVGIQEIWVQQGTYKPGSDRLNTFSIPNNVKLYGGFNGTEISLVERDWGNNKTILSGDIGIPNQISGNVFTVVSLINTNNAIIDGFIIEEGNAEYNANSNFLNDTYGGAVFLENADNNHFINCTFRNNFAEIGGAIYQGSGTNNKYTNCLFYENKAEMTNIVFALNGTMSFVNCTMVNNTVVDHNNYGIFGNHTGNITLENTVVTGNHILNHNTTRTSTGTLTATYSYLKDENPSGTGNIDGTMITDVLFKDIVNNDFTLQGSSALVDAGNNAANTETKDLRGSDRIIDGDLNTTKTIDIGAFEFGKSEQIITFNTLSDVTYGDTDFNLTATSNSGLTVTYSSSDTSVATISGNTVTILGAGTTTITASQAGNADFKPAIDVMQDLKVNGRKITITADTAQGKIFGTPEPVLTYTITSGSLINSDLLSGNSAREVGENVGLYAIQQGTLSNPNYDITFVSNNFEITKADQMITFNSLTDVTYGDTDFNINATADSGLTVSYTSSDTSVATVSGNTVSIIGIGTTTITASQSGNTNYNAAANVLQTLTVTPRTISVTADAGLTKIFGSTEPILTYTITNGNLVGSDVLSGSLTREVGENVGFYAIQQGSLANTNYAITFTSNDFEITKANQTVTFNSLPSVTYGDPNFSLNGTSSSGLPVAYTSSNNSVAIINGNNITIIGTGVTVISASQIGNNNFNPATGVLQTLTVTPKAITVTANTGQSKVFGSTEPVLTYTISNGNLISSDALSGNLTREAGENVGFYAIQQGTLANANYSITFISNDFEITKVNQTVIFNSLPSVTYGDANFTLNASSSSGLPIAYTSSNNSVAIINGNNVTIVGAGTTVISASQTGNTNFNPATGVLQTLIVTPKAITVTADRNQRKPFGSTDPVLTYAITNGSLINNDVLSGNLTRETGEAIGAYPILLGTLGNSNYAVNFITEDFEITKANQTITFDTLADVNYGDSDFELTALASSGLNVTFQSSDINVATISGNTVSIVGTGTITIFAYQDGNSTYYAAAPVMQTLVVLPKESLTPNEEKATIKIFPNPTTQYIQISDLPLDVQVRVYNLNGTLLKQVIDYKKDDLIDISQLPMGMYLLEITSPNLTSKKVFKKFIKS